MPPLDAGVHRSVRVVLEEQVVPAVDVGAAVGVVDPTVVRAAVQAGERRIRMSGDHGYTVAGLSAHHPRCGTPRRATSHRNDSVTAGIRPVPRWGDHATVIVETFAQTPFEVRQTG